MSQRSHEKSSVSDVSARMLARMSRGCYAVNGPVEFKLYPARLAGPSSAAETCGLSVNYIAALWTGFCSRSAVYVSVCSDDTFARWLHHRYANATVKLPMLSALACRFAARYLAVHYYWHLCISLLWKQVALLWQRDRATRLSVEILQLTKHPI